MEQRSTVDSRRRPTNLLVSYVFETKCINF